MSVGTAKPTSGAMSTATTFSYAQAAKGQSVSQAAPSQSNPDQTTPASNNKLSQDTATTTEKNGSNTSSAVTLAVSNGNESVGSASVTPTLSGQANDDAELKRPNEESLATSIPPSAPSVSSSQGAERPRAESAPPSEEKQDRSSTISSSRAQDPSDARKKKGKKIRAAEKDSEQDNEEDVKESTPLPPPELTEAPIPAVNIWQQRIEAQAAKAKMAPSLPAPPRSLVNGNTSNTASNSDQKPRSLPSDSAPPSAVHSKPAFTTNKPQKKAVEHARNSSDQPFRKSAPRGSRVNEKEGKPTSDALPSVANTASWPTPETAAVETKPQGLADKSDKDEKDDSAPSKSRKWLPIPFVPSVSFSTPLPARGGPRGGGRVGSTRGGREGASRGHQNAGVASTNGNGSDSRTTSGAPQVSKRTSADTPSTRESRKPTVSTDSPKPAGNSSSSHAKPESLKHGRSDAAETTTAQQPVTHPNNADRHPEGASKPSGAAKDTNTHSPQETTYPVPNGVHPRSAERTRGNGRGRGGHPSSAVLSHQPQPPFTMGSSGYVPPPNNSSRQAPQPFGPSYPQVPYGVPYQAPPPGNHRGRPGSISSRSQSNGGRHGSGRVPPMQPVNVPYDTGIYPQQPPSFNFHDTNILTLVQTQIEYYFSIDNLCKDMFLRRHMDSQGFVFLKFITQFRRMQDLTHDHNLIRVASENSREVELVTGEDGLDRLRRREGWETWVQPMDQRDPSAQNDGPKTLHRHNRPQMPSIYPNMMHGGYPVDALAVFSPNGLNPHFAPYMNGDHIASPMTTGPNGHAALDSHLSAAVPEFLPVSHPGNTGSERTASSTERDPNGTKLARNGGKQQEMPSPGDSGVHLQPNGYVQEAGEYWRESQVNHQAAVNGINGGHEGGQS